MQNVIENRQIGDKNQHKNLARQEKNVYNENILNEKYKNIIKEIINNDKINTFEIENVLIVVTRIQKKYQKVDKLEEFIEILKKIPISSQSEIFVFLNKYMIYILQILHDHFKGYLKKILTSKEKEKSNIYIYTYTHVCILFGLGFLHNFIIFFLFFLNKIQ